MRLTVLSVLLCLAAPLAAPLAAQEAPALGGQAPLALPSAPLAAAPDQGAVAAPPLPLPSAVSPQTFAAGGASEGADAPTDLYNILRHAHPVVQSVMAALAAMAFAVLTVLAYKTVELTRASHRLARSFALVAGANGLGTLGPRLPAPEAGSAMVRLIEQELAALPQALGAIEAEGLRERVRIGLSRIDAAALQSLRAGVGMLAQIAATAPFIGLFGTVFGIMNAFLAIAETKTTSLTVVAPGIAEALLATAVGLGAAIPAVIVYNALNRRIAGFRHRLADVAAVCERHLSREIVRRRLGAEA
ncbi:MotA/TolQ/ExbB proton channel family protein [Rhodobacter sp. KR11]|uniref:MotA/TolQ/ExbB proton channel family protein n=1 Tax=Rhodobacter sp. KR11 TaxID=2974588 RepID=UPI0022227C69|nr:MotA/TolQ/ExbB proton channel family protein [Rhodobacter sp. KR11]MCW1920322.1 MotA/TolQ/ExbB proton channel family protein [Rhodobacter sp. KR11]